MKKNKNLYRSSQRLKLIFIVVALLIVSISTFFTNRLANLLAEEEAKKIEIWAEANRFLTMSDDDDNMELILQIIKDNTTIPVIIADESGNVSQSRNVKIPASKSEEDYFAECIKRFSEKNEPIEIRIYDEKLYFYYDESLLLKQLYYFPYIQLSVIVIFILVAFFAFGSTKKAEQNRVWVGLSKETAHQLGTPISSLLAWSELLKAKYPNDNLLTEMGRDVNRLRVIAERFSKIGSIPDLQPVNLNETLENAIQYVSKRSSKKVDMQCHFQSKEPLFVELNTPLFEWVIENLCKNAIDAMDGEGTIDVNVETNNSEVLIDIKDSGKGLEKKQFKAIFVPGYTTKKRGWGLGLSLAKRIVEEYHQGKIFVKHSELNEGTTFRIVLKMKSPD